MARFFNLESHEGTASVVTQIDFSTMSKSITVTNDHASEVLQFKFNQPEDYSTLKSGESITFDLITEMMWVDGNTVPYRIWVFT